MSRSEVSDVAANEHDNASSIALLVKEKYGRVARQISDVGGNNAGCCGPQGTCCSETDSEGRIDPITSNLYTTHETAFLPENAVLASLGCGNPTALAELTAGEIVLDLGSGGGLDVLLSARRVGPRGKAYGLDMTPEMLTLARENARKAGVLNADFIEGTIESIPLPDGSVDVVLSNCVINLSADKRRVLAEAFRVLRPGGRFAVSDIVVRGPLPPEIRRSLELWVGCVAGALDEEEFRHLLYEVGFEDASIEPTRVYRLEDARGFLPSSALVADQISSELDGRILAAFVRARKPS
jgi:SAM-dependent methyltransferase